MNLDASFEPDLGALAQFDCFVNTSAFDPEREARQDRRLHPRAKRAAPCDLDGRGDRLGQVVKEASHFRARLEPVLGRELAPIGFRCEPSLGDADERVVGLVVVLVRKERFVSGDERNAARIGQRDQRRLSAAFGAAAVALQLDVEPIAEQALERRATGLREIALSGGNRRVERAARPASQSNQTLGLALQPGKPHMRRLVRRGFEKCPGTEPHQTAIAVLARGEEHDPRPFDGASRTRKRVLIGKIDSQRAADDRLDAGRRHFVGEFKRTEHVVGVGERKRRLTVGLSEFAQPRDAQGTLEQRIGRVHVQMDKAGHSNAQRFSTRLANVRARAGAVHRKRGARSWFVPSLVGRASGWPKLAAATIQSVAITCAQIATMPKNNASDAKVAASSTTARTMLTNSHERNGT